MTLYNCKTDGDHYRISKFTPDLEVESSYLVSGSECECPAGHRHTCRHRTMLPMFEAKGATRGQWFLDYDRKVWIRAIGEEDTPINHIYAEQDCPGHVASDSDPKVCGNCGVHIDSLRPPEDMTEVEMLESIRQGCLGNRPTHAFSMLDLAKPEGPITVEALDKAQFGKVLHTRPTEPKPFLRRI